MSAAGTFQQFVAAINCHDVSSLVALMTSDHVFVDGLGNRIEGASRMEAGWRLYFEMCPDYRIETEHVVADGPTVLAAGHAGGTIRRIEWRIPAAWLAVVRDGKVQEWRVYADNKPVYEILARS